MTYSIIGRCARSGMFGAAITTSSIAVGSRCSFARAKIGAVLTQHRTDPRLGPLGIDLLAQGRSAEQAVAAMVASSPHSHWRQLATIDRQGHTSHFSGSAILSLHAGASGRDCAAIGNILANTGVPDAMVRAFEADPSADLATRLLRALVAGDAAGGEVKPVASAALLVVHEQAFPYVDLRIDKHAQPIPALAALWQDYAPEADLYVVRALDPGSAGPPTPPPG